MANTNDAAEVLGGKTKKSEETIVLTQKGLQDIITAAITEANKNTATGFEKIAEALLESRKPYVDPRQQINDESMRQAMREQRKRLEANLKLDQASCQHIQGSNQLSDFPSPHGLTSIVHHVLDTGELIGICTNCTRIFRQGDEDYRQWITKKSGNRPSSAGRRFFADPIKAIKDGQK